MQSDRWHPQGWRDELWCRRASNDPRRDPAARGKHYEMVNKMLYPRRISPSFSVYTSGGVSLVEENARHWQAATTLGHLGKIACRVLVQD